MRIAAFPIFLSVFLIGHGFSQDSADLAKTKAEFSAADRVLNQVYQKAKASLSEYVFEQLQKEQREWVGDRQTRSAHAAQLNDSAPEGSEEDFPSYWEMSSAMTETRIQILNGWIIHDQFEKEWEGAWTDGNGGHFLIQETDKGHFIFSCEVVRGPTYHTGGIAGSAETNGQLARFTTLSVPGDPSEGSTWLHFAIDGFKLKVSGANTGYFHGMRAYFDGEYIRTAKLTEEDRKTIREFIASDSN